MDNLEASGRAIRQAQDDNRWNPDWCVIHELVYADSFGVVIGAAGDEIELQSSVAELFLAHADSVILQSSSNGVAITSARRSIPLMRLSRLKRSFPLLGSYALTPVD